ncbi:MAG: GNAT family N-acetyltransferase [Phycisphaerales bacterium]|nr:GNAT family N-acetyltransferase [Phycisphaerales bacterium]
MSNESETPEAAPSPRDAYGQRLRIRTAEVERDLPSIVALFEAGLDGGDWMDNDTGADVHNFHEAYCNDEGRSCFWVAELNLKERARRAEGLIIGMVGVQCEDANTAVIRRLRVEPAHQRRGVGTRLIEHAVSFCREKNYLKVVLDARVTAERAITLFERFSFQLNRTRTVRGERILDFYLDLYRDHDPARNGPGKK